MAKYDRLGYFLTASGKTEVRLSFSDIEDILGFELPRSAYTYPAWWANGGHTQADAWLKVGYLSDELDIPGRTVRFRREKAPVNPSGVPLRQMQPKGEPQPRENPREHLVIGGYRFQFVQYLIPQCENGRVKEYFPQNSYDNRENLPLLYHGTGAFCRFSIQAPAVSGVYLWVADGKVIYIGETVNLQQRFNVGYGNISPRNCYLGGQSTNCKMNKVVMEYYQAGHPIALYFHQTKNHKQVELNLLNSFRTKYNVKDN